jgi:hypothetical protein
MPLNLERLLKTLGEWDNLIKIKINKMKKTIIFAVSVIMFTSCTTNTTDSELRTTNTDTTAVAHELTDVTDSTITTTYTVTASETK